jgi:hypothetical protein
LFKKLYCGFEVLGTPVGAFASPHAAMKATVRRPLAILRIGRIYPPRRCEND